MAVRLDEAGTAKEVPVAELKRGDLLLIRPGASIPADVVVKEGTSAVNEAMLTGESKPMDKSTGDRVIAGTVHGQGSLRIVVTGTLAYTSLPAILPPVSLAPPSLPPPLSLSAPLPYLFFLFNFFSFSFFL